jgi:hypothetical protein
VALQIILNERYDDMPLERAVLGQDTVHKVFCVNWPCETSVHW